MDIAHVGEELAQQLASSEWFARGWTLQELLAPGLVVFVNNEWQEIGYKCMKHERFQNFHLLEGLLDLNTAISSITGVNRTYLVDKDTSDASAAYKLSWAASRTTSREEDEAYCLLALLGINMPLLYGEGRRAFRRLQEELIRTTDDDSIFTWDGVRWGSGILAGCPYWFKQSGNIVLSKYASGSHTYAMTNQGLQLRSPVRRLRLASGHEQDKDLNNGDLITVKLNCRIPEMPLNCRIPPGGMEEDHYPHVMLYLKKRPYDAKMVVYIQSGRKGDGHHETGSSGRDGRFTHQCLDVVLEQPCFTTSAPRASISYYMLPYAVRATGGVSGTLVLVRLTQLSSGPDCC